MHAAAATLGLAAPQPKRHHSTEQVHHATRFGSMARSTTPTRRPAPASPSTANVCRRVRLSSGAGACSPATRQPNGGLPSVFRLALPHATAAAAAVVSSSRGGGGGARRRRECACSPTTHPGSFRCALHRSASPSPARPSVSAAAAWGGLHEDARRSAMANSLLRIAAVEGGDHVRRAVAVLIRPSSHHQRRRAAFRPRPSRLFAMSAAAASSP